MAFIVPDRIYNAEIGGFTLKIKERIIPDSARSNKYQASYCREGDPVKECEKLEGGKALGICVHNTGDISVPDGTTPAEQYSRAMWPNCNLRGVAVHFFVYHEDIWQNLALDEQGWHSGDGSVKKASHKSGIKINGNLNTVSIEAIGDSPETTETTAKLVAYLLKTLSLSPETDIYTHNYFSPSKYCPKYILPIWNYFEGRVKEIFYSDQAKEKPEIPVSDNKDDFHVGETVYFHGGNHFSNANAKDAVGGKRKAGKAKITAMKLSGKHPYHLIAEAGQGSNVYGWVDASTFDKIEEKTKETEPEKIPESKIEYYPKTDYKGNSIVDGLKSIKVDSSYSHREKIALKNNISDYSGKASQNTLMLNLLKSGKLIKE